MKTPPQQQNLPPYLYHGTSAAAWAEARVHGIRPRRHQSRPSNGNWNGTVPSNPKAVYLTDAYPLHFAAHAAAEANSEALILEIATADLDPRLCVADEDVLEQANRGHDGLPADWSIKRRTIYYRARAHQYPGDVSLKAMGTMGYMGIIPAAAVRRAVRLTTAAVVHLTLAAFDPTITLINYQLLGASYRSSLPWLFGDADHFLGFSGEQRTLPRDGIEVLDLTPAPATEAA